MLTMVVLKLSNNAKSEIAELIKNVKQFSHFFVSLIKIIIWLLVFANGTPVYLIIYKYYEWPHVYFKKKMFK